MMNKERKGKWIVLQGSKPGNMSFVCSYCGSPMAQRYDGISVSASVDLCFYCPDCGTYMGQEMYVLPWDEEDEADDE